MIAIVDYDMGNIGSIVNMLKRVGEEDVMVSADPNTLEQASKLILPGVGAFDNGMARLESRGLLDVLNRRVLIDRVPVLGVCLGFQLLGRSSEEGRRAGLGWIDASTCRFDFSSDSELKVPHMGWNYVAPQKENCLLDVNERQRFYFVHSYYVKCDDSRIVSATTEYGMPFACAIQHENIMGVQFHPEKSHRFGMKLFRNFADL